MILRPIPLLLLVGLLGSKVASQCQVAQTCVADLTQTDCPAGQYLIQGSTIFGCCPGCEIRAGLGEICINVACAPGLSCVGVLCSDTGAPPPDPEGGAGCVAPSNCLPDGQYAAVQCKGDIFVGRCFCSDENGNRIFGDAWRDESDGMTCACSRRRAELEVEGRVDVSLHCTPTGNYEPLQCDAGLCWCAEPRTGQPTSIVLPQADMELLSCYSAGLVGEQYLRRCESVVYASAVLQQEQAEHGTHLLGNPITFCSYDGSYGHYQIINGIAYCTGRDGGTLGSWQVVSSEMDGMNCNCALDTTVTYPARGMSVTQVCNGNGNYRPHQSSGSSFWCVDRDGYPTTDYLDAWPSDMCQSYA